MKRFIPKLVQAVMGQQAVQCASMQFTRSLHLAPPFLVDRYTPASVMTMRQGKLKAKVTAALEELKNCKVI